MFIVLTNKYSVYGNIKAKAELSLPQVAWVFMRAQCAHAFMSRSYFHAGELLGIRGNTIAP